MLLNRGSALNFNPLIQPLMANKITYRSAQDMALKHISAYAKQLAKGMDTDYNYYIGQNIVSSSYLNTKETRRLNKLVLRQGKL